jgi:hypothetical protein
MAHGGEVFKRGGREWPLLTVQAHSGLNRPSPAIHTRSFENDPTAPTEKRVLLGVRQKQQKPQKQEVVAWVPCTLPISPPRKQAFSGTALARAREIDSTEIQEVENNAADSTEKAEQTKQVDRFSWTSFFCWGLRVGFDLWYL